MGLLTTLRTYSTMVRDTTRTLWAYRPAIAWLRRERGWTAAWRFLRMKMLVTEGEGSLGAWYILIRPLLKPFSRLFARRAPYPVNVEVEITTRCNKRCIFCEHTHWPPSEPRQDLSWEQFLHIVEQFPGLIWTNLTGEGDAFLNPSYLDMIRYLKDRDIAVYLSDSFDLITEEVARTLVACRVDGIYLSIDAATAETYERLKVGCSFERTLGNIKTLLRVREEAGSPFPEVNFRYIVMTENVHEMPAFVDLLGSIFREVGVQQRTRLEFAGLLHFPAIEHLFVSEVPEAIRQATLEAGRRNGIGVDYAHASVQELPPLHRCRAWMEPYIMMGGYVMPCCQVLQNCDRDYLREHCLGNIFATDFRTLWNSRRYRTFRELVATPHGQVPALCKGCRAYDTTAREEQFGIWYGDRMS